MCLTTTTRRTWRWASGRAWTRTTINGTRRILCSGSPNPSSRIRPSSGTPPGAWGTRAGTSNVPVSPCGIWANTWTSTVAASTTPSLTIPTRSRKVRHIWGIPGADTGSTSTTWTPPAEKCPSPRASSPPSPPWRRGDMIPWSTAFSASSRTTVRVLPSPGRTWTTPERPMTSWWPG